MTSRDRNVAADRREGESHALVTRFAIAGRPRRWEPENAVDVGGTIRLAAGRRSRIDRRMDKTHILDEIRRTATENGGAPLGRERFFRETGIRDTDWRGKYWARWGDAIREAGFAPNQLQGAYDEGHLFEKYVEVMLELSRIPTHAEQRCVRVAMRRSLARRCSIASDRRRTSLGAILLKRGLATLENAG